MSNLEQALKELAVSMTGKKADEIPNNLEAICSFIAANYTSGGTKQVAAPEPVTAAPTQEDFNGLIEKLSEAGIFS